VRAAANRRSGRTPRQAKTARERARTFIELPFTPSNFVYIDPRSAREPEETERREKVETLATLARRRTWRQEKNAVTRHFVHAKFVGSTSRSAGAMDDLIQKKRAARRPPATLK